MNKNLQTSSIPPFPSGKYHNPPLLGFSLSTEQFGILALPFVSYNNHKFFYKQKDLLCMPGMKIRQW